MTNTTRDKIIAKITVVYTTASPEVQCKGVSYRRSYDAIGSETINAFANDKSKVYVALKWSGHGPIYPAHMVSTGKSDTVGYAYISKDDIMAAHGKKRASKQMLDLASKTLTDVLACSYSDDGEL